MGSRVGAELISAAAEAAVPIFSVSLLESNSGRENSGLVTLAAAVFAFLVWGLRERQNSPRLLGSVKTFLVFFNTVSIPPIVARVSQEFALRGTISTEAFWMVAALAIANVGGVLTGLESQ